MPDNLLLAKNEKNREGGIVCGTIRGAVTRAKRVEHPLLEFFSWAKKDVYQIFFAKKNIHVPPLM